VRPCVQSLISPKKKKSIFLSNKISKGLKTHKKKKKVSWDVGEIEETEGEGRLQMQLSSRAGVYQA
jgi:hypothetical protein